MNKNGLRGRYFVRGISIDFLNKKCRFFALHTLTLCLLTVFGVFSAPNSASAFCFCNPLPLPPASSRCSQGDCDNATDPASATGIPQWNDGGEWFIRTLIAPEWTLMREWIVGKYDDPIVGNFWLDHVLPAMQNFTIQMVHTSMYQLLLIGSIFDAKEQLETQRTYERLKFEAHRDYQPSEDFCWFGTNVRSIAASEQKGIYNAAALSERQLQRQLGKAHSSGAEGRDQDKMARWQQFTSTYCDPQDNAYAPGVTGSGLVSACGATGGGTTGRVNRDIDYTRLIDEPRTLGVAFDNVGGGGATNPASADEEDVFAMASNLYGNNILTRDMDPAAMGNTQFQHLYMALRSVVAKRNVAQTSYSAIVGMKSSGTSDGAAGAPATEPRTREFLAAVLTELGVPPAEAFAMIGEEPSYYAQLEVLAKKIYQNPDFFTNLIDKPANVKRKSAALKAIELMLERAIFESELRQEMLTSVLLASELRGAFGNVNKDIASGGGG